MKFYENNPILKDDIDKDIKKSRLALALAVANTIKLSLDIMGIAVLERL